MKRYELYIEENGVHWISKYFSVYTHVKMYANSYFNEHLEKGGYIKNSNGKILKRYEATKTTD